MIREAEQFWEGSRLQLPASEPPINTTQQDLVDDLENLPKSNAKLVVADNVVEPKANYDTSDEQKAIKPVEQLAKQPTQSARKSLIAPPVSLQIVEERSEKSETTVKDKGSRCKVLTIGLVGLSIVLVIGAAVAYALIERPVNLGLSRMKSFGNALIAAPAHQSIDQEEIGMSAYLRQIKLDQSQPFYLPDRPETFVADEYFQYFEYSLPSDFIEAGNPQVKAYTAWADSNGVKALQFTFSNGVTQEVSPVFGNKDFNSPSPKTVELAEPVMSVQTTMLNYVAQSGQEVWGVVNFKVNSDDATAVGPKFPESIELAALNPEQVINEIMPSQRVIGVYGFVGKERGTIRSLSFKLAEQYHVHAEEELWAKIDSDFSRKTQQINADPSLLSELSLPDQLSLYGLSMQGYYGDNSTGEPSKENLEAHRLWQAWTDKHGLEKRQARILFLETVERLF